MCRRARSPLCMSRLRRLSDLPGDPKGNCLRWKGKRWRSSTGAAPRPTSRGREKGSKKDGCPSPLRGPTRCHFSAVTQAARQGLRRNEIKRVFYIGGTNIDPFVRLRFGRAFPYAGQSADADLAISERLNAVVEGAVWLDEALYIPSPLTLALRLGI